MVILVSWRAYAFYLITLYGVSFCLGYGTYKSCSANGGTFLGCSLVAVVSGFLKGVMYYVIYFLWYFFNGLGHAVTP